MVQNERRITVKKFMSYLKGWRGISLIIYMWLILMAWVVVYVDVMSVEMRKRFYIVSIAETILLALIYICPRLLRWAEKISIVPENESLTKKDKIKIFLRTWIITLGVFLIMYLIFYPGGFSDDNINQYAQAMGYMNYSDWHPAIHTLLMFTLPLRLSGNWAGSINLFQLVIFSLSLAYMACVMTEYANRKYSKLFMWYIMLNPATLSLAITPQKDTLFAITCMLLLCFGIRIYFTHGKWIQNTLRTSIFILILTLCTLFRHNAILFTLPLLFAVSLCMNKRRAFMILVCFLGLIYAVKYPLYESLNVERPGRRQVEMLGLPMSIIGNAVKETPERIDSDIKDFAYTVAPKIIWDDIFNIFIGFNSVEYSTGRIPESEQEKFQNIGSVNLDAIESAGWRNVLNMALRCFRVSTWHSLRAVLAPTALVYGIAGPPIGRIIPVVKPNDYGLANNNFFRLDSLANLMRKILPFSDNITGNYYMNDGGSFSLQSLFILGEYGVMVLFRHVFWCIGIINLVMIIFVLAKLNFSKSDDWKRLCFTLPLFCYNFGTMLLLKSNDFRYFYYSYLVMPLMLLLLLKGKEYHESK